MDLDAMTTLFGDHICNIKEKEYWQACQHTLKSTYELRANDGDGEGGTTLSDDDDGSEDKSNSSSDSRSNDSGHNDDDSNTNSDDNNRIYDSLYSGDDWGEPLVIEKMKMQIHSIKNMMMMWTTMVKILKMMLKLTGGVTLIVINIG